MAAAVRPVVSEVRPAPPLVRADDEDLGVELPLSTRIIVGASDFAVNNVVLVFGGLVGAFAGFVYSISVQSVQPDSINSDIATVTADSRAGRSSRAHTG